MHKEKKLLAFGSTLTDIYLISQLKSINPASRERSENFANVLSKLWTNVLVTSNVCSKFYGL